MAGQDLGSQSLKEGMNSLSPQGKGLDQLLTLSTQISLLGNERIHHDNMLKMLFGGGEPPSMDGISAPGGGHDSTDRANNNNIIAQLAAQHSARNTPQR